MLVKSHAFGSLPRLRSAKLLVLSLGFASFLAAAHDPILGNLKWREIGPAVVGGRIDDFAVLESNPDVIYAGTASGGLWKTTDGGIRWKAVFEHSGPMSVGAVDVSQSNPSTVWVGTGEANNRQSSSWGTGVFKSTDAGATWTFMGLPETHHIGRIVMRSAERKCCLCCGIRSLVGTE